MRQELILCDKCGKKDARPISVFIDRVMDAAGSMENEYRTIDLCHECCTLELQRFVGGRTNVEGVVKLASDFVDRIRGFAS